MSSRPIITRQSF